MSLDQVNRAGSRGALDSSARFALAVFAEQLLR